MAPLGTVLGEFEHQDTLLLACARGPATDNPYITLNGNAHEQEVAVMCEIARLAQETMKVIILLPDQRTERRVEERLQQPSISDEAIRLIRLPVQSRWIRDCGPVGIIRPDRSLGLLDADFVDGIANLIPHEDRFPRLLAAQLQTPTTRVPLTLQHGNFLSNGRGLCVLTDRVIADNQSRGYDAADITQIIKAFYGATQVVFLEPLQGESTGHVDMFATFTSADTIVVGEYPAQIEPINASVLNRNAEKLKLLEVADRRLTVRRIPMPPPVHTNFGAVFWPTYTNVVYANGVLLVPVYPGLDPAGATCALETYQQLLGEWTICPVNATSLIAQGGSLHCLTVNLPAVNEAP
jgi:agmatine/peptidylarginine deiminase